MANTPVPRSYSQILGGMLNSFLSRLGLPSVKKGDPSLSIMEAAAQSDLRTTQDIFTNLNAQYLDGAKGIQLDRIGRDERVPRITQRPSSGQVVISDSAVTPISSRIYQGGLGVVPGSTTLSIESAIPATGSLYIGRGTTNVEGPIAYTSVLPSGSFFIVTLATPVQNYHQTGESVIIAQGGDRLVPAQTIVSTSTTSAGLVISFRTKFPATILDGDNSISGVDVEATTSGVLTRVAAGAIRSFAQLPFPTAVVNNPLPFSNGDDTEDDDSYRERIRLAKKSRVKGIKSAIVNGLLGRSATDESGRIISVSTSFREGEPRTVYIDDGTGYQEKDAGVAFETLTIAAAGGEQDFSLANRPVTKAYLKTGLASPFLPVANSTLTVSVGGVPTTHVFPVTAFRDLNNGSPYEIASSINSNHLLNWAARVCDSGTKVAIYAKNESNEDIQLQPGSTSNSWLQLPSEHVYTLYLYRNDVLLFEDGQLATVTSKTQGEWAAISSGATLSIVVDGVPLSVTINNVDFVNAGTPYVTVSATNSLDSWAKVFNYKIAGTTTTVSNGTLLTTSNLGRDSRASIAITGGTLSSAIWAVPVSAQGLTSDYVLDRNSGQITLAEPLVAGDTLTAGARDTNGALVAEIGTLNVASDAEFWFAIDGDTTFPVTGIGPGTTLTWAVAASPSYGNRISITATNTWVNAAEGDWLVITDANVPAGNRGLFKVAEVINANQIQIERVGGTTTGTITLADGGMFLVRSSSVPQSVTIPAGSNYTPTTLAVLFSSIIGLSATPVSSALRLSTNNSEGEIAIVGVNPSARLLGFPVQTAIQSELSHRAFLTSSAKDTDGYNDITAITSVLSTTNFVTSTIQGSVASYLTLKFLRPIPDGTNQDRYSNQGVFRTIASNSTTTNITTRTPAPKEWLVGNRMLLGTGYDLTAYDTLQILLDNDTASGRYNIETFRRAKVVSTGGGWELSETNGDSLAKGFGTTFDWTDFEVSMRLRTKSHSNPDTNKTILWRWYQYLSHRLGPTALIQMQYLYQNASNLPVALGNPPPRSSGGVGDNAVPSLVSVLLSSGAPRSTPTFRPSSKVGIAVTNLSGGLYTFTYAASLAVSAANRTIRLDYTSRGTTAFSGTVTGGLSGATATVVSDSNPGGSPAASGFITVTGVVGTFIAGESLTLATAASTTYGYTVLTLTLPTFVNAHGLPVGEIVYFTPGDANFLPGPRQIAATTNTTISYIDTVATTASAGAIGSISNDINGEVTLAGSTVATGDIFSGFNASGFPVNFRKPVKITVAAGNRGWTGVHYRSMTGVNATLNWYAQSGSEFYPLNAANNVASAIATAVNAIPNSPLSAVAVGTAGVGSATGVIDAASYESTELGGVTPFYPLANGPTWIQAQNTPGSPTSNFVFTFRDTFPAYMLSNADLANEEFRLVPKTAKSVASFLNSPAVSGLANRGGAYVTGTNQVQIESETLGSGSSVAITGGTANAAGSTIAGGAFAAYVGGSSTNTTYVASMSKSDGIVPALNVMAVNAVPNDKVVFGPTTQLTSINVDGTITLAVTNAWTRRITENDGCPVYVEPIGSGLAVVRAIGAPLGAPVFNAGTFLGDWLWLSASGTLVTGCPQIAPANQGFFKVLDVRPDTIIIYHPTAVFQQASAKVNVLTYNSILPGDTVNISSVAWDARNMGSRVVKSLGSSEFAFVVDTSTTPLITYGSSGALGSESPLFRVIDRQPNRALMIIGAMVPQNATHDYVVLQGSALQMPYINEAFGTTLVPMAKLQFATGTEHATMGRDGYKYNTGLIAEANKIIFGDETNSAYEGIASAGASYNINGPVVKRVFIALGIRPVTGTTLDSVRQSVQSAVASAVNRIGVGQSIPISDIVAAAEAVNGVHSVAVVAPLYNSTNDQIIVQPYEKPLILDLQNDVTVSLISGD